MKKNETKITKTKNWKAGGATTSGVHPPWVVSVKTPLQSSQLQQ